MIKLIRKLDKKDKLLFFLIGIFVFIQVWLELKMPEYMATVSKLVQTPNSPISQIWENGLYMLLCAFGSMIIAIITGYIVAYIASRFSFTIRAKLFSKVMNLPQEEIDKISTASLITRTTNDITMVETFIAMGTMIIFRSPIMASWAITKILDKGLEWSIATAIAVGIMLTVIAFLIIIVMPKFKQVQDLTDKLNDVSREHISGIRVVRAFNAEKYQEDKSYDINSSLTRIQKFTQKSFAIMQPMMTTLMFGLTLVIYLIGANLIHQAVGFERMEIFGNMIVFSSYSSQVIMSFLMFAFMLAFISRSQVSSKRILEVFDIESKIEEGSFVDETAVKGKVEFRNVSFKYPNAKENLLSNISFTANPGETVAFIGQTGSGKSSLINLVPRFYDVTEGEILINDINIKEYKFDVLYNKIGYVSQKAVIFNLSVKENVNFGSSGKEISEQDMLDAIETAQAKSFIEKMDESYDTIIARGGTDISGGQKQRISIARAIARDPEIFIFDDSFSALDFKTESLLREKLKEKTKGATTLVVASRVGSVLNADKIVVLNEGKIEGIGSHKELWENCAMYQEIALSQLTKEELDASSKRQ